MNETNEKKLRTIRSFTLRSRQLKNNDQKAYDEYWPQIGLKTKDGMIHPSEVFQREAPLVLEIGFGRGDALWTMAEKNPDKNFIGVEVYLPGVCKLLKVVVQKKIENVRIYSEDVLEVLDRSIPDNSLCEVLIFFPDPWHKKRHHKRRLVQASFLNKLLPKIKQGGHLHLATDWEDYAEQMMRVLSVEPSLQNKAGAEGFIPRPENRPLTKFEQRGQRLGHEVWDLLFEKI